MPRTNNSAIKIFRGSADEVKKQPIIDRQFVIDIETPCFYVDVKKSRIPFGKNVDVDTEKIWEAIYKIESDINNSDSTMTTEKINQLVNEAVERVINEEDNLINQKIDEINKILEDATQHKNELLEKIENLDEMEDRISNIEDDVTNLQNNKQDAVFNVDDILYADKWDSVNDGDNFIHEYYYTNELIPDGASVIFVPVVTNSNEYTNLMSANLFTAIEYDAENKCYIARALSIPQNDIKISVQVTPHKV